MKKSTRLSKNQPAAKSKFIDNSIIHSVNSSSSTVHATTPRCLSETPLTLSRYTSTLKMKPHLSLRDFIRRSTDTVLNQYRQFLKLAKQAALLDKGVGEDVTKQIKYQYRVHQGESNAANIAVLIRSGDEQLEMLRGYVNMNEPVDVDNDSWLGATEPDGSDVRGRVGEQWPWQTKSE